MELAKVAIIGRPNVGKSALFNRIYGHRLAIIDEAEGITRDRLIVECEHFGQKFNLIDTGGIDFRSQATFNEEVKEQALLAIDEADVLVFVVDSQVGITSLDEELTQLLYRTKKPLILAVNKVDGISHEPRLAEFYKLGISKMLGLSASHGYQVMELLELINEELKKVELPEDRVSEPEGLKIAILGRPNVGKSTLINTLLNEKRCIVSPIAGTTRDSIDCPLEFEGKKYLMIDTAGVRRKAKQKEVVEKFAHIRTENTLKRADVVILMLEAMGGMTSQEKRLARQIQRSGKPCILFFNKWDLVKGYRMEHCLSAVRNEVSFLTHCPAIFGSALTGRKVEEIFKSSEEVYAHSQKRIPTGELNRFVEKAIQLNHPPRTHGKRLRVYYLTQTGIHPPTFILFVNDSNLLQRAWLKYLINQLRKEFGFLGTALRFLLKDKKRQGQKMKEEELIHEL